MKALLGIFLVLSIACSDIASHVLLLYGIETSSLVDQPQESEKESKKEESSEDSKIEIHKTVVNIGNDDLFINRHGFNGPLLNKGALYQELNNPPPEVS